jgi:alpha-N-arabinofuranosidase
MDLCELVGCEPYLTGNLGSGGVQEMSEWVEYMTSDADSPLANLRRQNGRKDPWKVKYFAIGNESWGCGGQMRPEFYADNFRRYNSFLKNYGSNKLVRIACGPSDADYDWTDKVMSIVQKQANGLSLHYYTIPSGQWKDKGSATDFTEDEWMRTFANTLKMDEYVTKHTAIMDKYDPKKRVGLVIDEWGTWYNVQPGTSPSFLYQQNTLRDAIVAALNFNIFHKHADRVTMTNIAQMVNVLQAMILTDGPKMVLTPTYHVFAMYKVHQDATALPFDLTSGDYSVGGRTIPAVSATSSRAKDGHIHVSLVNTDPSRPATVACLVSGATLSTVTGQVLTAATMQSNNTFDQPDSVKPAAFTGFTLSGQNLSVVLPPKSVVTLEL